MHQQTHIIIAEDDEGFRELLADLFAARLPGVRLSIVADGASALRLYTAAGADCLITDWQMPELDGMALTIRLRAQGATLPIVLMSSEPARQRAALAAGATRFVVKGARLQELLTTVQALLSAQVPPAESP